VLDFRRILTISSAIFLSDCAGPEAGRWISAEGKTVTVDGIPYHVNWVRDAAGIDMRGARAQAIVVMPDAMVERRRNTQSALLVGTELCSGKAAVISEMKDGDLYATRVKCD